VLTDVTSAKPLGAEWDPYWNMVIFVAEDSNVYSVNLNDNAVGILCQCKSCRSYFWLRTTPMNLFYMQRGYVPPNTHRCGQHLMALPPHVRDVIKRLDVPNLGG